jgi:hypothetical protein
MVLIRNTLLLLVFSASPLRTLEKDGDLLGKNTAAGPHTVWPEQRARLARQCYAAPLHDMVSNGCHLRLNWFLTRGDNHLLSPPSDRQAVLSKAWFGRMSARLRGGGIDEALDTSETLKDVQICVEARKDAEGEESVAQKDDIQAANSDQQTLRDGEEKEPLSLLSRKRRAAAGAPVFFSGPCSVHAAVCVLRAVKARARGACNVLCAAREHSKRAGKSAPLVPRAIRAVLACTPRPCTHLRPTCSRLRPGNTSRKQEAERTRRREEQAMSFASAQGQSA